MTTVLRPSSENGQAVAARPAVARLPMRRIRRGRGWLTPGPARSVTLLLAAWPLWWALGVGDYMPIIIAIPMVYQMYLWRAKEGRRIRVPPGFGYWAWFLLVLEFGVA